MSPRELGEEVRELRSNATVFDWVGSGWLEDLGREVGIEAFGGDEPNGEEARYSSSGRLDTPLLVSQELGAADPILRSVKIESVGSLASKT